MSIRNRIICALLACSVVTGAFANTKPVAHQTTNIDATIEKVRDRLMELYKKADIPGISASFVLADGQSGAASVGYSNMEQKTGLQPLDRMLSGSVGKTYVSALALRMVAEHRIKLDDKLSKYLGKEGWFKRLPNSGSITLRNLMNHTSGIPEHVLSPAFIAAWKADPDKAWTPAELVSFILDKKPLFAAGKDWAYADTNYVLLGMVLEKVGKAPLFDQINDELLEPLGLSDTNPSNQRKLNGLATGYAGIGNPFVPAGPVLKDGILPFNPQAEYAGGGMITTTPDLARWAKFLYESKVFPEAQLKDLLTTVRVHGRVEGEYGLGVEVRDSQWGKTWGHDGWFPGYLTCMIYFPDSKIAIAVQMNSDDMRAAKMSPYDYALEVAKVVMGTKQP